MSFKDLGAFTSLSQFNNNSVLICNELLGSNLYIKDLLELEGCAKPVGSLRAELIERMAFNDRAEKAFNMNLIKGGVAVVAISVVVGFSAVLINHHLNKKETKKEIKKRQEKRTERRHGLYRFGDKFKNGGKVVNGVGKFLGKGLFGAVNALDKLKI